MLKPNPSPTKLVVLAAAIFVGGLAPISKIATVLASPQQEAKTVEQDEHTNESKPVNFVSVAQLEQIKRRIPKLKPGMSDKRVFSVLGISKSQLDSILAARSGFTHYSYYAYTQYNLREGVKLELVHNRPMDPEEKGKFERAELIGYSAPVETQATQIFLAEMERMNPRLPQLKEAISQGADINAPLNNGPWKGFPALHIAVWHNFKLLSLLVEEGADVNAQDRNGDTAMAHAAASGQLQTVLSLLDHGANPDIRNVNGRSVLGKAQYTMTRPALPPSHKRKVQIIINILKSKGAQE